MNLACLAPNLHEFVERVRVVAVALLKAAFDHGRLNALTNKAVRKQT
jgi:hypothetical protein